MFKAFDTDKFHFVEGDTDSSYWAIAGDQNESYTQGFKHIIKDKQFYDNNVYKWFPDPNKGLEDEKKLLGVSTEKEGTVMFAVSPKCYYLCAPGKKEENIMKAKGADLRRNHITPDDYKATVLEKQIIQGENCGFYVHDIDGMKHMVKMLTRKNIITPIHNKMICLDNYSCAPIIQGLSKEDYECQ
jgi:hypothetical protein